MEDKIVIGIKSDSKLILRNYSEKLPNRIRTEFMRDRDRILYSEPFRRLAGKTQVYSSGSSDLMRTRLTHTLEVTQIARTISASLNLNCDLTEAIALGHDIGHTPFGHVGERTLHSIMTPHANHYIKKCPFDKDPMDYDDCYGFKHNLQGVKLAYSSQLNLTNYTLFGIQAHSKLKYKKDFEDFHGLGFYKYYQKLLKTQGGVDAWSLEAYVVAIADEIAQRHHDLEDAINGRIITKGEVINLLRELAGDNNPNGNINSLNEDMDVGKYEKQMSSLIVNLLVSTIIDDSRQNILNFQNKYNICEENAEDFLTHEMPLEEIKDIISYSEPFSEKESVFAKEIQNRVLQSYEIQVADSRGAYVVKKLFQAFYTTPQQLPDNSIISYLLRAGIIRTMDEVNLIRKEKGIGYIRKMFGDSYNASNNEKNDILLMRVICDYIAGMTDNYALDLYRKLYGYDALN